MAEGSASGGVSKSRAALGDITNRIGKRTRFEKGKDGMNSVDFSGKDGFKRMRVPLQPCTEINSLKGNVISSIYISGENKNINLNAGYSAEGNAIPKNSIDVGVDCDKGQGGDNNVAVLDLVQSCNNNLDSAETDLDGVDIFAGNSKVLNEGNDSNLVDLGGDDDVQPNDELADSFAADSSRSLSEAGDDSFHAAVNIPGSEVYKSLEGIQSGINIYQNDVNAHNTDENLILSQSGSVDCTILPQTQESRELGADKTINQKDTCAYVSGNADLIRSCSCSFCTKAAHIWLDLHHQDIKARMSAIKKSQKEAIGFVERSCRNKVTEKYGTETRVSNLESELRHQWRFLFQRMADLWEEEGNQLGISLLSLTELREKLKADLEFINAKSSKKG